MTLTMIKKDDKVFIKNGDEPIEDYSLSESIDFSGLMSFLLKTDLSEKIDFDVSNFKPDQQDLPLLTLLNSIKDNYNKKVDEYESFKKEFEKTLQQ